MNDKDYMELALELAQRARLADEVPVGALLVLDGEVIGKGWNQPISRHDPTAHAEIVALREAAQAVGNYRLPGTVLYVTLEPCTMCVGAVIQARVKRLVFGAHEPRSGAVSSAFALLQSDKHNHSIKVRSGVLGKECAAVMRTFFAVRR